MISFAKVSLLKSQKDCLKLKIVELSLTLRSWFARYRS